MQHILVRKLLRVSVGVVVLAGGAGPVAATPGQPSSRPQVALPQRAGTAPAQQSASGPATRAELLRRLRQARRENLRPHVPGLFERTMAGFESSYLMARVMRGWRGFRIVGGEFPSSSGIGAGVAFVDEAVASRYPRDDLRNRLDVYAGFAKTTRDYTDLRAEVAFLNVAGTRFGVRARAKYSEWKSMPFFGRGNRSRRADRANFRQDTFEAGGEIAWRPGRFDLSAGASLLSPQIGPGESRTYPDALTLFDPAQMPGVAAQPDFIRFDVALAWDTRPTPRRDWTAFSGPGGGYYAVRYSRYDDRGRGRFDFSRWELELQQYLPVPWRRAFVLRANAVFSDPGEGDEVPFYFQPTLGGRSMLRSFPEYRFYDENRLLVTAEYRWAAWSAMNAALFVDAGKVYPHGEALSLDGLRASYGIGFRFKTAFGFLARVDLARGSEGFRTVAVWKQVF